MQKGWYEFMVRYLEERSNLNVILHLVDGRHGLKGDDWDLMKVIKEVGVVERAHYVVVLTKVDKLGKKGVKEGVVRDIEDAFEKVGFERDTPIILTSAVKKIGRDDLWNYLRLGVASLND